LILLRQTSCLKRLDLKTPTLNLRIALYSSRHNHSIQKPSQTTTTSTTSYHSLHNQNHPSTQQTMGFLDSIRAKVELYRLEQRYTHRNKRTTFTTGARYVDGEYIFDESPGSPTGSTGSWQHSTTSSKRGTAVRVKELMSRGVK
jgi:hypothetical protein